MEMEPGKLFEYNNGASALLGKIFGVATGKRLCKWAAEKLFGPIGIASYHWNIMPDKEVDRLGWLYLSAHDLARVGLMMLRNSKWKSIVSENCVRQTTTRHVVDTSPDNGESNRGYGYRWTPGNVKAVPFCFFCLWFWWSASHSNSLTRYHHL
ncbi:serine hydrolase [Aliiglaciecola sp. 1_MG-2023]|nr:serine hydrolase [Aliiglaciecola sp. 1_MG-2023]